MRLLHTSDWHIGKKFSEVDLLPLQEQFGDWLVDFVQQEQIDALLLAGDIFDRAMPSGESVDLVDDMLNRIRSVGVSIVAISGNHDSAERLNFGARFMAGAGLHIRAERSDIYQIGAPLTLTGKHGEGVDILPLPYVDPQRVQVTAESHFERTHASVLGAIINNHLPALRDPSRTVVMSHAFIANGIESDSERPLVLGGTGMVPSSIFDGFGYVALGHLHRPQQVGHGNIVYSGSPMSYSFSEEHQKSVRIVEIGPKISSTAVPINVGRPVATLSDTLENLLQSSKYEEYTGHFIRARITDTNRQLGVADRLRQRFPHFLEVEQRALMQQGNYERENAGSGTRLSPAEVVTSYVEESLGQVDSFQQRFIEDAVNAALVGQD